MVPQTWIPSGVPQPTRGASEAPLYVAPPPPRPSLADCWFYHTLELPGHGLLDGHWDLRGGEEDYLGNVSLAGKRVLEIGTASGHLCFHMERQGASVVAFDIAEHQMWDFVPFPRYTAMKEYLDGCSRNFRRLHNSFWLGYHATESRAKVVHGNVYNLPAAIGPVDVVTFGCVLLHLRDPFLALANGVRFARELAIVTQPLELRPWEPAVMGSEYEAWLAGPGAEFLPRRRTWKDRIKSLLGMKTRRALDHAQVPCMVFMPDHRKVAGMETWWFLTPLVVQNFLGSLGFEDSTVHYHTQRFDGKRVPLYTVTGRRTHPMPARLDGGYPWFSGS